MKQNIPNFDDIFDLWSSEQSNFFLFLGVFFVLFLICFLILVFLRRKRASVKLTIKEHAKIKLKEVEEYLNSSGEVEQKVFYAKLIFIVKEYLGQKYSCKSESKTDEEFLSFLKTHGDDTLFFDLFKRLRQNGSRVKFESRVSNLEQLAADYSFVVEVIEGDGDRFEN